MAIHFLINRNMQSFMFPPSEGNRRRQFLDNTVELSPTQLENYSQLHRRFPFLPADVNNFRSETQQTLSFFLRFNPRNHPTYRNLVSFLMLLVDGTMVSVRLCPRNYFAAWRRFPTLPLSQRKLGRMLPSFSAAFLYTCTHSSSENSQYISSLMRSQGLHNEIIPMQLANIYLLLNPSEVQTTAAPAPLQEATRNALVDTAPANGTEYREEANHVPLSQEEIMQLFNTIILPRNRVTHENEPTIPAVAPPSPADISAHTVTPSLSARH